MRLPNDAAGLVMTEVRANELHRRKPFDLMDTRIQMRLGYQ